MKMYTVDKWSEGARRKNGRQVQGEGEGEKEEDRGKETHREKKKRKTDRPRQTYMDTPHK